MIMSNFPLVTSILWEFQYLPRDTNVSQALDEVLRSIAEDDVNTWHEKMMNADIERNYDMTLPCVLGVFASLALPATIADQFYEFAIESISNPVDQQFMKYQYFPNLKRSAEALQIPLQQRLLFM